MKHKSFLEKLSAIRGSGSFVHQGSKKVKMFGLSIDDFGDLPLPIIPLTAKGLLSIAKPSPFGRGEKKRFLTTRCAGVMKLMPIRLVFQVTFGRKC
jgi:hypothetical protein